MNKIDNLARIARQYGITESANLRDDIVSEYTDIIESLNTIDESIIVKDISLLPVYKINESTKAKDNMPKKCTKCGSTNIGVFLKGEPIYQCKDCGQYLGTVPFKEGYAIDLDSLKYVVESKQVSVEEAIQEIRDVNYIGDTYPMYCVLPENINENISLESFTILNDSLEEAGIIPISIKEFNESEFIVEAVTAEKLEKTIAKYEKARDELIKKKETFMKMSKEEQKKFCIGKTLKNVLIASLIAIPTFGIGSSVYATYQTIKGENPSLGPNNYIKNLNIWINLYNQDITNFKKKLKELEKDKK